MAPPFPLGDDGMSWSDQNGNSTSGRINLKKKNEGCDAPGNALLLPAFPYSHSSNVRGIPSAQTLPSPSLREGKKSPPCSASLAFTALQFLPSPLLVVSRSKTVVLANESMGRLLGVEPANNNNNDADSRPAAAAAPSITDILYGKHLRDLNFAILQRRWPLWVSWDQFLEALALDMEADPPQHPAQCPAIDVLFSTLCASGTAPQEIAAKMTVSLWVLDGERYFTLMFNSMAGPDSEQDQCLEGSSQGGGGAAVAGSSSPQAIRQDQNCPPLPHAPVAAPTEVPSVLQKITRMKDAVLDAMEIPVFAVWHDGSITMANRAARDLQPANRNPDNENPEDIFNRYIIWSEDFSRVLTSEEYPIRRLLKNRKTPTPQRVGMLSPTGGKIVYDTCGEGIYDEQTGEFLAGLVWLRDVTEYEEKLVTQRETNELRFMTMCDSMPQLVCWRLTQVDLLGRA